MSDSSPSLLLRLRRTGDQVAWGRLVDLYSPHLFLWACRAGLQGAEAAELVREVFTAVAANLPEFRAGSPGGCRTWLRGLAHAQRDVLLSKRRVTAGGPAAVKAPPVPTEADVIWEEEYLPLLLRTAIDVLQTDFPVQEWKAFQGLTIEGRSAADVARETGTSIAATYAADAHVLARLRLELAGMLE